GVPYKINGSDGLLKFGAKVRSKDKNYTINQNTYENLGGVPNLDQFAGSPVKDKYLSGRYEMGNPLDIPKLVNYFNANPAQFELQIADKAYDEALESYKATEDVFATYIMARQQVKKLMILGGVRYERTKVGYNSKDVIIAANGDIEEIRPVSGNSVYDFILPQLHLKYELDKFSNLRAAVTYSYARPNFSEIIPAQEINREDEIATVGNAALKPVKAINYDLMAEHYFGSVGIVSAGLFYKKLDNFIYRRILFNSSYPLTGTPVIPSIDVVQSQNGNDADVMGVELAFQRRLSFIPLLKDFSVYLNYTYTHSKANLQSREADEDNVNAKEELRLPGQADHVGNASLAYEGKKFSARVSLNFNGSYLSEIGGTKAEDIFIKNRAQLDATVGYALTPRFRVFAEMLNITNQPLQAYQNNTTQYIQREFYSYWMRFGLKFNLQATKN
ncbi:MAG: TonB-dependent receptor, partial [Sphingobacteriales bacterium]